MTERGQQALTQRSDALTIGPSQIRATESGLTITVEERTSPWGQRVSGEINVRFNRASKECFQLDQEGHHWWWPLAPIANIEVTMDRPALSWRGPGYVDSNLGNAPVEHGFNAWNWCRGHSSDGDCEIHYDVQLRGGGEKQVSLRIDRDSSIQRTPSPPLQHLPKAPIWRVARPARLPISTQPVAKTLEDTPFYTRSRLSGPEGQFMHESLDVTRLCRTWVQLLLPFRMPRRG